MDTDTLADRIDETRITYDSSGVGTRIDGSAFVLEFENSVDPEAFCDELRTPDDPWRMFGITLQLADEQTDDGAVLSSAYWKLAGVLLHDDRDGASKITLEVTSEWARVYVKADCCEHRAAEFVQAVDDEYGVDVQFGSDASGE